MSLLPRPAWSRWEEAELDTLSDEQIRYSLNYWLRRHESHNMAAEALGVDHPRRYRESYSAWWCAKRAAMSYRVLLRRGAIPADELWWPPKPAAGE